MTKKLKAVEPTDVPVAALSVSLRRCIGSARYAIGAHEAPVEDFPRQPSQKDGLGRMCKTHWNAYTAGLARDAKARKAGGAVKVGVEEVPSVEPGGGDPPVS